MAERILVSTIEDAVSQFFNTTESDVELEITEIVFGSWASKKVHLDAYNSEIVYPFISAYSEIQLQFYRLVALSKYGSADKRLLSQEDLDNYILEENC